MKELTITNENFDVEVMQSPVPVLLDFWASWCGPCKMLSPIIAEIAGESDGSYKVGKVNVDEQPKLAAMFSVMSIPTVVVIKGGKIVASAIGYRPKAEILALLG